MTFLRGLRYKFKIQRNLTCFLYFVILVFFFKNLLLLAFLNILPSFLLDKNLELQIHCFITFPSEQTFTKKKIFEAQKRCSAPSLYCRNIGPILYNGHCGMCLKMPFHIPSSAEFGSLKLTPARSATFSVHFFIILNQIILFFYIIPSFDRGHTGAQPLLEQTYPGTYSL